MRLVRRGLKLGQIAWNCIVKLNTSYTKYMEQI